MDVTTSDSGECRGGLTDRDFFARHFRGPFLLRLNTEALIAQALVRERSAQHNGSPILRLLSTLTTRDLIRERSKRTILAQLYKMRIDSPDLPITGWTREMLATWETKHNGR